jgi:hypothetical protein
MPVVVLVAGVGAGGDQPAGQAAALPEVAGAGGPSIMSGAF